MPEQRQYVRMSTVFPVELEFKKTGSASSYPLLQGFTRNVSSGGICVELKIFGKDEEKLFHIPGAPLGLTINTTFSKNPIQAAGRIAWIRKEETTLTLPSYFLGIAYTEIDDRSRKRLMGHAQRLRWIPRAAAALVLAMAVAIAGLYIHERKLVSENRALVNQMVLSAGKKSDVAAELNDLQARRAALDRELSKAQEKILTLERSVAAAAAGAEEKESFEKELGQEIDREKSIGAEIETLRAGREKLKNTFKTLQANEALTASSGLRQMYGWLMTHQNHNTGLVASYEGDPALEANAYTYDQSLVAQAYLLFGDVKNAEAILSFFESKAEKKAGGFYNAYHTVDSTPTENNTNTGPSLWVGIAALQYEHRVKDGRFLPLAESIGAWAIALQDSEGGLKGGPDLNWYSTEHNLDAYAFFRMLHEETGKSEYGAAAVKSLVWIKKYAYSQTEGRMQRGKGDSTIATDTFSWAIAAIGPATLKKIDLNPADIIDYAEKHCEVSVTIPGPDGKSMGVRGFDFAKAQNVGRGGIISTEWTAQMIVAYQMLAAHHRVSGDEENFSLYQDKADFYLSELQKLIITSSSRTGQGRGCLPYASIDNVDTGHGWRTPKGRRTGSVAGTAYGLFAWVGYNPFNLDNDTGVL